MLDPMEIVVNNTGALVYVIDLQTYEILYANKRCVEEFGNVVGSTCYRILQRDQNTPCHFCPLHQHEKNPFSHPIGTRFEWENQNSINNRDYMFVDQIIQWYDGRVAKVLVGIDITSQKRLEAEILHLAHYDSLTGLPNRLFLKELLTQMMTRIEHHSKCGALLFIDLDHFKVVNDTQGHGIGDLVLMETSQRIRDIIRQTDIVARLGGDEFVVAIEMDDDNKSIIIDKIGITAKKILEEVQKPYFVQGLEFSMSASIGIILFNDHKHTIDELMKFADGAMYNAKENGRNRHHFFDPKLQQIMELKTILLARLRKAIENQSFVLFYQPQISAEPNTHIVGVEALVRWADSEHGIISPVNFIPLAEESGLIVPLGEWILREAMKQLKEWEKDDIKKFWRISINISAKQFEKENFTDILFLLVKEYQIMPSKLRLELTEGLLFKNTKDALQKLQKIKDFGFTLSIDDFGMGYSSLSYLKQLPINELKIDQSFIRDLVTDSNDFIIVETILSIGRKFKLEVVAEGVETQEQYEQLLSMGCTLFQGYLFAKPSNPGML